MPVAAISIVTTGFGLRRWMKRTHDQIESDIQAQASQERARFLQRLDHELKNPLTAMQVALANLSEIEDPTQRRQIAISMNGQIRRLSTLVSSLRKLAQLEHSAIERVPVNTGILLEHVVMSVDIEDRDFHTEFNAHDLPTIYGDRDLLQLAIYNVLDNAIKFTGDGAYIGLNATVANDLLTVSVQDNGRGISDDDLPHVWEDLYRSPQVHGIPGSGIGLALVRTIVERHDGWAEIESEPGIGTTVTLFLPLTS